MAESSIKFGVFTELRKVLQAAFETVTGHNHDGSNSRAVSLTAAALANGKILVGNASGVATAVTPSGDVTVSNAGVTAIGAGKVTLAQMAATAKTHIQSLFIPGLEAGVDFAGLPLLSVPVGFTATLTSAKVMPYGDDAGIDDSNTSVFQLTDGTNSIVSKTYNATTTFPNKGVAGDLGTLDATHKVLAASEVLTLNITNGTTAATPPLLIQVTYTLADAA